MNWKRVQMKLLLLYVYTKCEKEYISIYQWITYGLIKNQSIKKWKIIYCQFSITGQLFSLVQNKTVLTVFLKTDRELSN